MAVSRFPRTFDPNAIELNQGPPNPERVCAQRSEIVELFTEVEKHPDKCLDFPLSFVSRRDFLKTYSILMVKKWNMVDLDSDWSVDVCGLR